MAKMCTSTKGHFPWHIHLNQALKPVGPIWSCHSAAETFTSSAEQNFCKYQGWTHVTDNSETWPHILQISFHPTVVSCSKPLTKQLIFVYFWEHSFKPFVDLELLHSAILCWSLFKEKKVLQFVPNLKAASAEGSFTQSASLLWKSAVNRRPATWPAQWDNTWRRCWSKVHVCWSTHWYHAFPLLSSSCKQSHSQ